MRRAVHPRYIETARMEQKNYITPEGYRRMVDELTELATVERPKVVREVADAAAEGDRSENAAYIYGKKRLREIDRRIRFLTKRLEAAEVVDPARQKNREQIFFGATVTYVNGRDEEHTLTIVGVDETEHGPNRVSWVSPIARALLKARIGDSVEFGTPGGREEVEVLAIAYGVTRES